jgi:hypothetical protein
MGLYQQIPFRVVPVEQDLSPDARAQYRMRVPMILGNQQKYVAYYLKLLEYPQNTIEITKSSANGTQVPYQISYANMHPTPPAPAIDGVITPTEDDVNVSTHLRATILGSEVMEVINAMFGGDTSYARVTEYAFYSGEDQVMTTTDYTNTSFQYTEAICAQMNVHRTFNGVTLDDPQAFASFNHRKSSSGVMLV